MVGAFDAMLQHQKGDDQTDRQELSGDAQTDRQGLSRCAELINTCPQIDMSKLSSGSAQYLL